MEWPCRRLSAGGAGEKGVRVNGGRLTREEDKDVGS